MGDTRDLGSEQLAQKQADHTAVRAVCARLRGRVTADAVAALSGIRASRIRSPVPPNRSGDLIVAPRAAARALVRRLLRRAA